ncbi:homeobox protein CDX-1-like isoform X1 [Amphibalanus amphitrite]|uniref:homeobox protein CDX-1-like isoform X1 n=1 Tax=Amphibalanus amphitrite TaxID=1232801 RepID=UPI001C903149|nr:homeobox protein CDX-1-like isoform X1 [Amphibalanus amphitrite]
MFSQTSRDCAGAGAYNFYPMYHAHHAAGSQTAGYGDSAATHLTLPYSQYPSEAGYWDNYHRSVIGGYNEWHGQGFGGAPPLAAAAPAHLATQPGTPSPQQCPAGPGVAAGRNDSPDSGIVTGAADLPLSAGSGGLMSAPGGAADLAAGGGYPRPQPPPQQQQQQQQQSQQQPQPARDSWEWLDRNSYPTSARPPPGKTRTKDKYRVVYSDAQRLELEKEFRYNNYITIKRKLELSRILGLTDRQVKIWFQNRRAKERKQKRRMEETAKRQMIDLQQGGGGGGGGPAASDIQLGGLNHAHLQGVHGLVPLHRQTPVSGGGGGGGEAGRFPRYSLPAGHPMHSEMAASDQHQHHQQHHQQHQMVTKSEPRDGEPTAF